ncbi:MAG: hypothetical protein HC916_20050 [Coleofasciculaceae cyanobacterium SM2_1_6]|nr:hypothetical protein [Coleofasciculaceae cyanobacterium SM2_1_6]
MINAIALPTPIKSVHKVSLQENRTLKNLVHEVSLQEDHPKFNPEKAIAPQNIPGKVW